MYGLVNLAVKDLIIEKFGSARWEEIRLKANVSDSSFEPLKTYPDAVTYGLVGAASQVLGASGADLLRAFGRYWVLFTAKAGYGEMMDLFGSDIKSCLKNLNSMHGRMGAMMPDLKPPRFVVRDKDGAMTVEYHSTRPGLTPMVEGLIEGLAEKFKQTVTIESKERLPQENFDTFVVRLTA